MALNLHRHLQGRAALAGVLASLSLMSGAFAQTSGSGLDANSSGAQGITITAEQEQQMLAAMGEAGAIGLTRYYYPSLGAGIPTGFGANWGDIMFSVSGSNSDKVRDDYDGSMSFTVGLGNSSKLVGLELFANNLSIRNFGDNWSFGGKVHRMLYEGDESFLSFAIGRDNLGCSGGEACSNEVSSNYAVLSGVTSAKNPFGSGTVPLSVSFGMGNGYYSYNQDKNTRYSPFGDVGIQLHDQVGVGVGWSGVGLNANVSFVPVREWPVILNVLFADITDRSRGGFNVVVTVGIPFNFLK
jgi:hypothetical protein